MARGKGRIATPDDPWARKRVRLGEPHVEALERYRAEIAAAYGAVPHFDPDDGGDGATILILLETPASRGDPVRFVSRDNATGTARNLTRLGAAAGLDRRRTLLWNAVPWIIHTPERPNRPPTRAEVEAGLGLLPSLLRLLPSLHVAVLAGRAAGQAEAVLAAHRPAPCILRMPHPSPTYVNTSPAVAPRIEAVLREAALRAPAPFGCQPSMKLFSSAMEAKR